jgi:hypothetical protein
VPARHGTAQHSTDGDGVRVVLSSSERGGGEGDGRHLIMLLLSPVLL